MMRSLARFSTTAAAAATENNSLFVFKVKTKPRTPVPNAEDMKASQELAIAKYQRYSPEDLNNKIRSRQRVSNLEFLILSLPNSKFDTVNVATAMLQTGLLAKSIEEETHVNHVQVCNRCGSDQHLKANCQVKDDDPVAVKQAKAQKLHEAMERKRTLLASKPKFSSAFSDKLFSLLDEHHDKMDAASMLTTCYGVFLSRHDMDDKFMDLAHRVLTTTYTPTVYNRYPRNAPFSRIKGLPDAKPIRPVLTPDVHRVLEMLTEERLCPNVEMRNTMVDDYLSRLRIKQMLTSDIVRTFDLVLNLPNYGEANGRTLFFNSLKTELFKRKYEGMDTVQWNALFSSLKRAGLFADDIFDFYALRIVTGYQVVQPKLLKKMIGYLSKKKQREVMGKDDSAPVDVVA